jgi:hypothetical protein
LLPSHLAALGNDDIEVRDVLSTVACLSGLHLQNNVHAVTDLAKNDVLVVQEGRGDCGNEELRAICIWPGVGHGEETGLVVLESEVFVIKGLEAPDAGRAGAITVQKISALAHELGNYTVKLAAFVALRSADRVLGLAGAELAKVLGRLGNDIFEELKGDAAKGLTSNRNVKEDQGQATRHQVREIKGRGGDLAHSGLPDSGSWVGGMTADIRIRRWSVAGRRQRRRQQAFWWSASAIVYLEQRAVLIERERELELEPEPRIVGTTELAAWSCLHKVAPNTGD